MKKRSMKRELKQLRRDQYELWTTLAATQSALLHLYNDVYESDDDGGGDEVEAPRLRVVGDD